MKGISTGVKKSRVNPADAADLKNTIKQITGSFLGLLSKNKMLALEILFEFPSREIKDQILSNYSKEA